jgi:hypothetical protein
MIHFDYLDFPNLSLPQYAGVEGLVKWTTNPNEFINNFKNVIPAQSSFFISKSKLLDLCAGNGWLTDDSEVYAFLFCIGYDEILKSVYYRIRTISILKTDLKRSQNPPIIRTVRVKIHTSPIAITQPNKGSGIDCLKFLQDINSRSRERIDREVESWKNTVRTRFNMFLPLPGENHEPYIGDIVGKGRILKVLKDNPESKGITLTPALYKSKNTNTPFIVFSINPDYATLNEDGAEPLKCPPGSTNPCRSE